MDPARTPPVSTWSLPCALLAAGMMLAGGAEATTVTLSARTSVNHVYYFGGFAISGDEGQDGAPNPGAGPPFEPVTLTALEPRSLAIHGSDHADLHYLFWSGYLDEQWDQAQTYDLSNQAAGATLSGSGHSAILQTSQICGPESCDLATELQRSTNTQALEFTLDGKSRYTLTGGTSGGQWVDLLHWDEPAARWFPVVSGATVTLDTDFELSGALAAGRYMLRNKPYTFSAGGSADVNNAWNYSLVLADATALPLPAAGSGLALACSVLLPALRRRAIARPRINGGDA